MTHVPGVQLIGETSEAFARVRRKECAIAATGLVQMFFVFDRTSEAVGVFADKIGEVAVAVAMAGQVSMVRLFDSAYGRTSQFAICLYGGVGKSAINACCDNKITQSATAIRNNIFRL
jgi:ascorbate-specific PTS system EIIC-type component UlaA